MRSNSLKPLSPMNKINSIFFLLVFLILAVHSGFPGNQPIRTVNITVAAVSCNAPL